MTFKEFASWCNQRACDGMWGLQAAVFCSNLCEEIYKYRFSFRRENIWNKHPKRGTAISLVKGINERIAEVVENGRETCT